MSISKETSTTWHSLHLDLQKIMQEELSMLRDLLASMKEEEKTLMFGEPSQKTTFSDRNSTLHKQLKTMRKQRNQKTKDLFKIFNKSFDHLSFNSEIFDALIAQDEDNASETFSLRDQILAIMKNIDQMRDRLLFLSSTHFQSARNAPQMEKNPTKPNHQKIRTLDLNDVNSGEEIS